LKKIKHALLSSQETIAFPVQASKPWFLSALPRKLCCGPAAVRLFRCVVSLLYQVFRAPPNWRFVSFLFGVKPVCFVCLGVSAVLASTGLLKRLSEVYMFRALLEPLCFGRG
ncbi:hypothetical protein ACWFMI_08380, partial [Nocardiopsis terrae]